MRNKIKLVSVIFFALAVCFVSIAPAMAADSVTGTIEEGDSGLVLQAEDGIYILAGQDLTDMVGMKIKVTGTIEEGDAGKTLTVTSFEEVQE
jgi:succinate-acetate transporter protein